MHFLYILNLFTNLVSINLKKRQTIFVLFTFAFFVILRGGSTSDPDWLGYFAHYVTSNSNTLSIEFGYKTIQQIFYSLGFEYQMFRLSISLLSFSLMYYILNKFIGKKSWSLFLFSYSLFLVFYDSIQIRNFIGFLFVLLGLFFLFEKKRNKIVFIICVLIGASFHISMVVYLIFLIPYLKNYNFYLFFILLFSVTISSLIVFNGMRVPFIEPILSSIDGEKYLTYFKEGTSLGSLYPIILQIINYIYIYIISRFYVDKENTLYHNQIILNINLLSFSFVPFFMVNLNFYRFIRNIVFLNLIIGQRIYNDLSSQKQKISLVSITIIYILAWCFYGFVINNEFSLVVENLLTGNYWFK